VAGALSPVPGGVGPVTTALLLRNTALAAERQYAERRR
jgi:methylenetetrahydrofolate dehydrogenase (NADP+)/methenyltetrahydrofolate cyclohydrolase